MLHLNGIVEAYSGITENAIDGAGLLTLTEEDLKTDLKVTKPLILRKILNSIKVAKADEEKKIAAEAKKAAKPKVEKKLKPKAEQEEEEEEHTDEETEEHTETNLVEIEEDHVFVHDGTRPKLGSGLTSTTHECSLVYKLVNKIHGYETGWICDECRATHNKQDPSYHCDKHNYDLCLDCAAEMRSHGADTTDTKRKVGDHLTTSHHEDALTYKLPGYEGSWSCDVCRTSHDKTAPSYHCDTHGFDLCVSCAGKKDRAGPKPALGTSIKADSHADALVYMLPGYASWSCDECRQSHAGEEPSFHCRSHGYDLCLHCAGL